jgi:hypothetical protein
MRYDVMLFKHKIFLKVQILNIYASDACVLYDSLHDSCDSINSYNSHCSDRMILSSQSLTESFLISS